MSEVGKFPRCCGIIFAIGVIVVVALAGYSAVDNYIRGDYLDVVSMVALIVFMIVAGFYIYKRKYSWT